MLQPPVRGVGDDALSARQGLTHVRAHKLAALGEVCRGHSSILRLHHDDGEVALEVDTAASYSRSRDAGGRI